MLDNMHTQQEVEMNSNRNPIAKSFAAGINQAQVIASKRRDRRVKHRNRWREDNACGADEA